MPTNPTKEQLLTRSKSLRVKQTDAEKYLWSSFRNRRLKGLKFRRQVMLGHYIVDFVCLEKKVIVEVDGGHHSLLEHYDQKRTAWLKSQGFCVLRFWNNDVLRNVYGVLDAILEVCGMRE